MVASGQASSGSRCEAQILVYHPSDDLDALAFEHEVEFHWV